MNLAPFSLPCLTNEVRIEYFVFAMSIFNKVGIINATNDYKTRV